MKTLFKTLCALFITANVYAQCGNIQSSLIISTGYDPVTSGVLSSGNLDPMWKVIQGPPAPSGFPINFGGPAYVIPKSIFWDDAGTTSAFINAYGSNNGNLVDNWTLNTTPFIFERKFCICDPNGGNASFPVTIDLHAHADNWTKIYLEDPQGNQTLLINQTYSANPTVFNFLNPTDNYTSVHNLTPGTYKLVAYLRNKSVDIGLSIDGTISSQNGLLSDADCDPTGTITGYKYNDLDQTGTISSGDALVPNWPITLYNSSGTVIATQNTDANGMYFFSNITPGTYTVKENAQPGWTMVNPANGIQSNVVVTTNGITQVDFLNYNPAGTLGCDLDINVQTEIEKCQVKFTPSIQGLPNGYQVISTKWTFGDGTSSQEFSPTHFYQQAGQNYLACLEVVIFNGDECCTQTECISVDIQDPCGDECIIEGKIEYKLDPDLCVFDFTAVVNYTQTPITTMYWDFGDGTTGFGSTNTHTFPGPGNYVVTLFLFSSNANPCCFEKIEIPVKVDCEAKMFSKKKEDHPTGIQSQQNENFSISPNPTSGSFKINFELNQSSDATVQIIDLNGRQVYRESLGKAMSGMNWINIDVELPAGVYICTVHTNHGVMNTKLVIE